jgi:hypothetical protein
MGLLTATPLHPSAGVYQLTLRATQSGKAVKPVTAKLQFTDKDVKWLSDNKMTPNRTPLLLPFSIHGDRETGSYKNFDEP